MLKRQRPVSPFSSVPLIVDPPVDFVERDTKRRRTLPPVLDGAYRGWAQAPPLSINDIDDDGEEDYVSDDEIEDIAPNFSINCSLTPGDKAEYTSTNSLLRELHTLQQHRLLFSSVTLPPSPLLRGSNSKDATHSSNILPYPGHTSEGHFNFPAHLERPQAASQMPPPITKLSQQQSHELPIDEIHSVTEHYEGTNKFLGSLFLSRRSVLDSSDYRPGS